MTRRSNAVYIISVAAELAGVHPQTLRIYERKGLIEPFRTPGGTRRYSDEDLERLGLIQELTAEGVNLEGVRRILSLQSENDRLRTQVDRLRRLLGEAQARTGAESPHTTVFEVEMVRRRNLPDIRREPPFGDS
jgi:MerR family transcriptional regulator/heat shock protein HspR